MHTSLFVHTRGLNAYRPLMTVCFFVNVVFTGCCFVEWFDGDVCSCEIFIWRNTIQTKRWTNYCARCDECEYAFADKCLIFVTYYFSLCCATRTNIELQLYILISFLSVLINTGSYKIVYNQMHEGNIEHAETYTRTHPPIYFLS